MGRAGRAVATLALAVAVTGIAASAASTSGVAGSSGHQIVQGTQSDGAYATSGGGVTSVFATTQKTSCFAPEVPLPPPLMTPCNNASNTGEALSGYPTQAGSNPGFATGQPMLVQDHSESDIRVDPTNSDHIIGTSKWFVSAPGYNHQLGFYESTDGGTTWNVQGHIPGWEGWTDNTDPVGAFDTFGNFFVFNLAYQFFYDKNGGHNFTVGKSQEPNPVLPAEVVGVSVRPHGSTTATAWSAPQIVASYDSVGNEPDKQWLTIDTTGGQAHSHTNRIYAMWVNFHTLTPVPYVSYSQETSDGVQGPWSTPQKLPTPPHTPQGSTYLLPHVAPDGTVYTTVTNFNPAHQFGSGATVFVDKSTDGGVTWTTLPATITIPSTPPLEYANTTFRDGIEDTFAVGSQLVDGHYPLYVAYEDYSAGVDNVLLTASSDDGATWSTPIQVNDNSSPVDEFQPNLSVSPTGTVSVAWYDRRLPCQDATSPDFAGSGIAASDPGAAGASNYCVNASVQFYRSDLTAIGNNVRLTEHTWDPQLNSPHPGSIGGSEGFIGDYFGNDASVGTSDVFTFVSTYDNGSNPGNHQQQVVAKVATP
jgi:hypothetical protein